MNKIIVFLIFSLLLSCSIIPTSNEHTIDMSFANPEIPNHTLKTHTPPAAITNALIPDINQTFLSTTQNSGPTQFNISLHDIDAREFFMGLVIDTDENMLVHPDVSGLITLELKNVTVAQVMDAVQKVYGYDYKKNDIGYIVYPATLQTKIFKLNRLDLIRAGESSTRVSSGQISNTDTDTDNNRTNQPYTDSSSNTQSSGSWIKTKTETDFWLEINTALRSIIAIDPQASVVITRQTGVIVVRAKPMQLREVEQFIKTTQKQLNRQVIIEAKIIEIILDDSHQAGVNWQSLARTAANVAPILTGIGAIDAIGDVFTISGTWGDFSAMVELLETQGKTNILSSPRISTLNNQKAIIKVGSDEYFITNVSSNTVTSGSSTITNPDITWTPFFSGIALDVTPQINDNDEITLHIHPSITRVENQIKDFTINGEDGSLPMALNTVRESDSIVKAKNGQIIVIGGLMQESKQENKKGIAGLTQIPYLGNLFRVNTGEVKKSELVILLKPTLINSDDDWLPTMNTSKKQLKQLQNHPLWK
ncbi:MAG: pilus (MSHA type) biogenesis protein MshL [Methylococcaceae bacterium]|nr:pilus (MSHA type) biogenesis protein MshL [Methylococcaceae bacterium]